ncbi:MAG: DUF1844 domain-containing protein [Gemmatimonadetes bacterium]|uniref:DUF1844 domain-containing protein n=1 Tax=Candidatus Kutchimonas denitrificans TaxID=3056748 RepID=A0AAE5CCR8_9BACT|nr:DUF1844 domain-containing protein [Gemmatimonadota bacterium]NIR74564.1 DUF1844 domain-containing protein [Candidatus Kutchimonas denitrificans]NIS02754.1 DUF1844 domain-containing protein [Gemmatimonadota bacterium]NIT68915.1 DUF1844 domain-containing protein [Gemmatimonadota bacterium]NIU52220.1 DUF1844 domain-containing protein [Gemmatimonadota bacterium]
MTESKQKVDFSGLVTSLATSAVVVLGQIEGILETGQAPDESGAMKDLDDDEKTRRVDEGLAGGRHLIDTLVVLEEKTRGNLNEEEQELLGTAISELRIRHVTLSNRVARDRSAGGEDG